MAKNMSYTRTTTDRFAVKGELSQDGKTIKYEDDKKEATIAVEKLFKPFCGGPVEFVIATKLKEDLGEEE